MSETRERIASHVEENPGVHFNALTRRLDLAGQVQYHLDRLVAADLVDRFTRLVDALLAE